MKRDFRPSAVLPVWLTVLHGKDTEFYPIDIHRETNTGYGLDYLDMPGVVPCTNRWSKAAIDVM